MIANQLICCVIIIKIKISLGKRKVDLRTVGNTLAFTMIQETRIVFINSVLPNISD